LEKQEGNLGGGGVDWGKKTVWGPEVEGLKERGAIGKKKRRGLEDIGGIGEGGTRGGEVFKGGGGKRS